MNDNNNNNNAKLPINMAALSLKTTARLEETTITLQEKESREIVAITTTTAPVDVNVITNKNNINKNNHNKKGNKICQRKSRTETGNSPTVRIPTVHRDSTTTTTTWKSTSSRCHILVKVKRPNYIINPLLATSLAFSSSPQPNSSRTTTASVCPVSISFLSSAFAELLDLRKALQVVKHVVVAFNFYNPCHTIAF